MEQIMKQVALDLETSKALYLKHSKRFAVKECYNNIYRAIIENFPKARTGKWKVAYGYYSICEMPNLLARHCFIIDDKDNVIDPTIFTHKKPDVNHQYFIMHVFDSLDDYLAEIARADYKPALISFLRPYEKQAYMWAQTHNYYLCG